MQPAKVANELVTRSQMQMVRIGENHLRPDLVQVDRIERLHGRQRADGHEGGCVDASVRCDEMSRARSVKLSLDGKPERAL